MTKTLVLDQIYLTLSATSGPVEILKDVNFECRAGESVAIVGPSGSGKSSLISVAAGLERATSGRITLLGADLTGKSEDELARLRRGQVSLVFQSFHLLPTMTALDNVCTPLEIARIDKAQERACDALDAVGLSDRLAHYPGQLSGGERQRVAVARALASSPKLVFADEPTGNLDAASGKVVSDLLFQIARERGATLILVTHDRQLAQQAGRVVEMFDGRIL